MILWEALLLTAAGDGVAGAVRETSDGDFQKDLIKMQKKNGIFLALC
jgi:hypothetical protein